jgi:hypothetical protein
MAAGERLLRSLQKKLKFVDTLNNVFVKITIYSPIEKLDISLNIVIKYIYSSLDKEMHM